MNSLDSHRWSGGIVVLVSTFVVVSACQPAMAATVDNWSINSGGSWNVGTNWSTGSIPTMAEDAMIGSIATSVASPASITLDAVQTAYGLTLNPGEGKSIHVNPGGSDGRLKLLSNDTAPDGVNKFFTINAISGLGNQINAPIFLGGVVKGTFVATINSFDPAFTINGGISEFANYPSWGVKISGNGRGIVSYATTATSYSGDTTIASNGILRIDLNNAVPSGVNRGNVVLEGNGQLQFFNATAQAINALSSTSTTALVTSIPANNGVTLTVGSSNATGKFAGSIVNPTGTGLFNLIKIGSGTQRLDGADSYRGTTTVSAGTLLVNGKHTSAGNYSTAQGATLGGTGTISLFEKNSVTVSAGSLAPGDSGPGVLNIAGTLNMSNVGTLRVELGGSFPGNGPTFYDQLNVMNPAAGINASFAHLAVTLVNGFKPKPSDVFYILTRADLADFTGRQPFEAYPEGAPVNLGGGLLGKVTYKANWAGNQASSTVTGGNDMAIFNITSVPEPASVSLLGLAVLSLSSFGKRQR
jgi:autotransporter-associated beta strand protein